MKKKTGSLTVETAMVLPIFMILVIALLSSIEMMKTYSAMEYAVHETAKELAYNAYIPVILKEYAGKYDETVKEFDLEKAGIAVRAADTLYTETAVRAILIDKYGLKNLNNSLIKNKSMGLHLFRSDVINEKGDIDLIVTYNVEPWINVFGVGELTLVNRAKIHSWTGYVYPKEYDEEYVYVTPSGSVYHTNRDCTYLHISVSTYMKSDIEDLRNKEGKKYNACKLCGNENEDSPFVFVTDYGENYHSSLACSGIKRTIIKIKKSEIGDKKLCERCRDYQRGLAEMKTNE